MTGLLDLLDLLDQRAVNLTLVPGPGPGPLLQSEAATHAIDDTLAAAIAAHRDMILAVLLGRLTGHAPGPCTTCGEVSMVGITKPDGEPRTIWPTCRLTPNCTSGIRDNPGRHVPRPVDINRTAIRPTVPQARQPAAPDGKRLFGPWPAWPTEDLP